MTTCFISSGKFCESVDIFFYANTSANVLLPPSPSRVSYLISTRYRYLTLLLSSPELCRYSGALYVNSTIRLINDFNLTRYTLVIACFCILFLSYFLLIRPTTMLLARTINQANAMMLLLPPQIIRAVKEIQTFVDENISKE